MEAYIDQRKQLTHRFKSQFPAASGNYGKTLGPFFKDLLQTRLSMTIIISAQASTPFRVNCKRKFIAIITVHELAKKKNKGYFLKYH